ncbi:hypothetical protein LZ32DRAFT_226819 [Colletotrichum eremochloae]|nr:hypothetical protein LZ32DRAFT_226819 [Colletotrichum eremochloae]
MHSSATCVGPPPSDLLRKTSSGFHGLIPIWTREGGGISRWPCPSGVAHLLCCTPLDLIQVYKSITLIHPSWMGQTARRFFQSALYHLVPSFHSILRRAALRREVKLASKLLPKRVVSVRVFGACLGSGYLTFLPINGCLQPPHIRRLNLILTRARLLPVFGRKRKLLLCR